MQNVEFIVHNAKYVLADVKYYLVDLGVFDIPYAPFYVERDTVKESVSRKIVVEPTKNFDEAVGKVIGYGGYEKRSVSGDKILRRDYLRLRNVYSSLRYIRKQTKYRRLHDGDLWLLVKKIAIMLNGFEYAEKNGLDVPDGLKRFYEVYKSKGIGEMLERVREHLGIEDVAWKFVVRRLVLVYNIRSVWLEYKYGLKKIPKRTIIAGINDRSSVMRDLFEYIPVSIGS